MSQFKELDDKVTLKEFISHPAKPKAVGRLDYDSEGLLLLSDDDRFIRALTSPKSRIEKEYFVQVEGSPKKEDIARLTRGITTLTEIYAPCFAEIIEEPGWLWKRNPPIRYRKNIPTSWIKVILQEGKNRQVRKMAAFIGYPALRLVRVRIGNLSLGHLRPGESKVIEKKDI
ncbi:MAG: pseudouridine synthase [Leptospiraceae bacterium]|nr:pseudouridine synthase [Leptospiraceae bacterium]